MSVCRKYICDICGEHLQTDLDCIAVKAVRTSCVYGEGFIRERYKLLICPKCQNAIKTLVKERRCLVDDEEV